MPTVVLRAFLSLTFRSRVEATLIAEEVLLDNSMDDVNRMRIGVLPGG